MEDSKSQQHELNILDVLGVDLCARPILELVPVGELLRLERVSRRWQQLVHAHLRGSRSLSLHYLSTSHSLCSETAATHRTINISLNDSSLQTAITTVQKWGASLTKVTTGSCDEELFEAIASNCEKLRSIEFYNLGGQSFPIDQIKKCKNLNKITFRNIRISSESDLRVTSDIVQCRGIEFDNIDLDSLATDEFIESIKSINLQALSVAANSSSGTATLKLDGTSTTLTFLGISPDLDFFMSMAKSSQRYRSMFRHKIEHILEPLFNLNSS